MILFQSIAIGRVPPGLFSGCTSHAQDQELGHYGEQGGFWRTLGFLQLITRSSTLSSTHPRS